MSDLDPLKAIKLIIESLQDDAKPENEIPKKELKEFSIDIFSKDLFQKLYLNLLYFNTQKKETSKTEEQIFLLKEIVELLGIIYKSNSSWFFKSDLVKSFLIFAVYFFKEKIYMSLEIILKMFLSFENILKFISKKEIENEVLQFETDIIPTRLSLINKYSMVSLKKITIFSEKTKSLILMI